MEGLVEKAGCRAEEVWPEDGDRLEQAGRVADAVFGGRVEALPAGWEEGFGADDGTVVVLGYWGGQAVGFGWGRAVEDGVFAVRSVGVLADFRGRGVGSAVLGELERSAKRGRFGRVRCTMGNESTELMRLSLSAGMRIAGVSSVEQGTGVQVVFEKGLGDRPLGRSVRREFPFSVEAWPIKRACELEKIYQAVFGEELDDGHPSLDEMILVSSAYSEVLHVAVVEGRPVGFKHGQERTRGLLHSNIGAVHPHFRGGGVASALLQEQHGWAASEGFGGITTNSKNRYPQMLRLNLKHGFGIVGVVEARGELAIHLYKPLKGAGAM